MNLKQKNAAKKAAKNFKGVYFDTFHASFRTILFLNSKRHSAGYHKTAEEAAKAYNKKAKSLFGKEKLAKAKGYWNVLN